MDYFPIAYNIIRSSALLAQLSKKKRFDFEYYLCIEFKNNVTPPIMRIIKLFYIFIYLFFSKYPFPNFYAPIIYQKKQSLYTYQ